MQNFDYDTDYSILWKLYSLSDYFDLVAEGVYEIGTLKTEADFYSQKTLQTIQKKKNFNEIKNALELHLEDFKAENKIIKENKI